MEETVQKKLGSKTTVGIVVLLVIALVAAWYFFVYRKKKPSAADEKKGEKVVIYGSIGCPYTVKQMEKYPDHEFVDCTSQTCPDFVTAYPTTKFPDGKIEVGFS